MAKWTIKHIHYDKPDKNGMSKVYIDWVCDEPLKYTVLNFVTTKSNVIFEEIIGKEVSDD